MTQILSQTFPVVSDDGKEFILHEYTEVFHSAADNRPHKGNKSYALSNGEEVSPIDKDTFKNIDTEQILRRKR